MNSFVMPFTRESSHRALEARAAKAQARKEQKQRKHECVLRAREARRKAAQERRLKRAATLPQEAPKPDAPLQ